MEPFRRLEDLTLMDDYMFGMVMRDPKLLRSLLEAILDMHIRRVTYIEPQRTVKDGFGTKGVRLTCTLRMKTAWYTTSKFRPRDANSCPSACATISPPSI